MESRWDVVVVGGGHAGCEAALASARLGARTLLLTADPASVARMSCNPAIGGLAKGNVVREIDAMGGAMGLVADRTGIQFKVLNASRGPAVRGPRCQSDKARYAAEMTRVVSQTPGLTLARGSVAGFTVERGRLCALVAEDGSAVRCHSAVVTTGTFLRGLVHVGDRTEEAGRWGEPPARGLSAALSGSGLRLVRLKTGTPPRVRSQSIERSKMSLSSGDSPPQPFSVRSRSEPFPALPQVDCWLTHTGEPVHEVIRNSLDRSPLYSGKIVGRGPRYCPSIEDKVVRFPEKDRHQVFVEPEGLDTDWVYLNGLSMSLPPEIQERVVRGIPGLGRAEILRPAYAVEYDAVSPEQLDETLQVRGIPGLHLAGQINGTSGYEEAAGQGLVAGTNAARRATDPDAEPFVLGRHESYVGVMIDDLVTLGTEEPYRLLTSRAEYRLLLGADSAYARLTPRAVGAGLVSERDAAPILEREARLSRARAGLEEIRLTPSARNRELLLDGGIPLSEETTVAGLLRRPGTSLADLGSLLREPGLLGESLREDLDLLGEGEARRLADEIRYEGFLVRERETLARTAAAAEKRIPDDVSYRDLPGLSAEAVEKLERHRPRTLGQAARIPGVPPSAVTRLLCHLAARGGEG